MSAFAFRSCAMPWIGDRFMITSPISSAMIDSTMIISISVKPFLFR